MIEDTKKLFEEIYKKRNTNRLWIRFYYAFARLTTKIDYNCNFNKDGFCRRTMLAKSKDRNVANCCVGCNYSHGYRPTIKNKIELKFAIENFDRELGFWRKNNGCILPRSMRSLTCLVYICTDKESYAKKELLIDIQYVIKNGSILTIVELDEFKDKNPYEILYILVFTYDPIESSKILRNLKRE